MTLRTKLIIAFLLMSVLPLSGIVLYSYFTSLRAFERAVESESREMTEQIGQRMDRLKREFHRRIEDDWAVPFVEMARDDAAGVPHQRMMKLLERDVAAAVPWLDSLEWVPEPAQAPPAPPGPGARPSPESAPMVEENIAVVATAAGEAWSADLPSSADTPWVIQIEREDVEAGDAVQSETADRTGEVRISLMRPRLPRRAQAARRQTLETQAEMLDQELESLSEELEVAQQRSEARATSLAAEGGDLHAAIDEAVELSALASEIARLELKRQSVNELLGADFSSEVTVDGRVLGEMRAQVSAPGFLREVLAGESLRGEVPFALDPEGNVYAHDPQQREKLLGIQATLEQCAQAEGDRQVAVGGDWMVVTERDPDSSLVFGIARPVADSLADMRGAAVSNFAMGVGMIGLALLGILPLSSRMTRRINHLTERAERLASGDLSVRADVNSSDEIGQLGRAFNRMAEDISTHQDQLLEQQLQQRLLESEHERKSSELEAARRFQLSLLPRELPATERLELAVFMKTATEVGGDYYDFELGERGDLTIAIGDATGHGAVAGTMVTVVKSLFSARASDCGPQQFLEEASRAVNSMRLGRMSMALALARFEPLENGEYRLTVSSAGMPPLLVHRSGSGALEELELEGLPLGVMGTATYEERTAILAPEDCVLLMSDGFPELVSGSGEVYGYGRVHEQLRRQSARGPQATLDALAEEVVRWTGGRPPGDDVTFVALRLRARASSAPLQ